MKEAENVSEATWSAWILDAIRKIRSQKQRPSVERICHAIRQHHNYHEEVIAEHLEHAVKEGTVLKVFNKGQSSYKDPGGVINRQLKVTKGTDLCKVLVKAARELGERDGSSLKSIERYIYQSHHVEVASDVDFKSLMRMSLKRAVARGLLIQDGRLFKPPVHIICNPPVIEIIKPAKVSKSPASSPSKKKSESGNFASCGDGIKPSLSICWECLGTAAKNPAGTAESLSSCHECGSSVHLSCVAHGADLAALIARGNRWLCEDCASCSACSQTREQNCLLCCYGCDKGFHINCLNPAADRRPKGPWSCKNCLQEKTKKSRTESSQNSPVKKSPKIEKEKSKTTKNKSKKLGLLNAQLSAKKRKLHIFSPNKEPLEKGNAVHSSLTSCLSSSFLSQASNGGGGGRDASSHEETSEPISKEKQKFFRLSAFYSDNQKTKRPSFSWQFSRSRPNGASRRAGVNENPFQSDNLNTSSSNASDNDWEIPTTSNQNPLNQESEQDSPPWGFAAAAYKSNLGTNTPNLLSGFKLTNTNNISSSCSINIKRKHQDKLSSRLSKNSGQLKGLFDGLSHLFATPSRNRTRSKTCDDSLVRELNEPTNLINSVSQDIEFTNKKFKDVSNHLKIPPNHPHKINETYKSHLSPSISLQNSEDDLTPMTPSRLVKTAVTSKSLEQERRRMLKVDTGVPFFGTVGSRFLPMSSFFPSSLLSNSSADSKLKKKHLIAEATQTQHQHLNRYHHQPLVPVSTPLASTASPRQLTGKNRTKTWLTGFLL